MRVPTYPGRRDDGQAEKPVKSLEQHYSVKQVAEKWNVSEKTVKAIFEAEPDVLRICNPRLLVSKRARRITLRIPASAVARVHEYRTVRVLSEPKTRRSGTK